MVLPKENLRNEPNTQLIPAMQALQRILSTAGGNEHAPDAVMPEIASDEQVHSLARDLRKGTQCLRRAGEKYLPKNLGEDERLPLEASTTGSPRLSGKTLYEERLERSSNIPVWKRTIEDISSLPFRHRIVLKDFPDEALQWAEEIDDEGQTMDAWAAQQFNEALYNGVEFSFVDNDPREFASVADRLAAKARPYTVKLPRSAFTQMIKGRGLDGRPRLERIAFHQPVPQFRSVPGSYGWNEIELRVLRFVDAPNLLASPSDFDYHPTSFLLAEREKGKWEVVSGSLKQIRPAGSGRLDHIPLYPHYTNRIGPWRGITAFLDTAEIAKTIWVDLSELQGLAREFGWVRLYAYGLDDTSNTGANKGVERYNTRARIFESTKDGGLDIGEPAGHAILNNMKVIELLIHTIEKTHNQITSGTPRAPVSAREVTLEAVHASSRLELWTLWQEVAWTKVMRTMCFLGGLNDGKTGTASVPHDFGLPLQGLEMIDMAHSQDRFPDNEWIKELRRYAVVGDDFDDESAIEWLTGARALRAAMQGVDPAVINDFRRSAKSQGELPVDLEPESATDPDEPPDS